MDKKNPKQITLEKALNLFTVYGYDAPKSVQSEQESGFTPPSYYKHYNKRPSILDTYLINKGTKQIILEKAITLFATKGYDGVSVAQLAQDVGIKAPSLYKHYANKRAIFDTILLEVTKRIDDARNRLIIPMQAEITGASRDVLVQKLNKMYFNLLSFYLQDEFVCKFRRMLSIERYHNVQAEALFQKIFFDDVLEMQTQLFTALMHSGLLHDDDAEIMALMFYAPLFMLMCKADNMPPDSSALQETIDRLVASFVRRYVV